MNKRIPALLLALALTLLCGCAAPQPPAAPENPAQSGAVSEHTVKTHVTHIYEKFRVSGKDALLMLVHTS